MNHDHDELDDLEKIFKLDPVGMPDTGFIEGQLSLHPEMKWGDGSPLTAEENHVQICGINNGCGCAYLEDILRDIDNT